MIRGLVFGLLRWLLRLMYHVELKGMEHLHNVGDRALIVANHTSFLDAILLSVFLPEDIGYAIHSSYYKKWWMRPLRRWTRLFAVDHGDPMAMKSLIKHVKEGHKVVIFPEGRITATGSLMKVYPGPGMVADKADADILPIRIDGAQYTPFSRLRGQVRLRWFPTIKLTILPAHHFDFPESLNGRERRREAGRVLSEIMTEMVFETSHYHRRIWDAITEAAYTHGSDHLVLEDLERTPLSYKQLILRSFLLGNLFRHEAKQGERVGVLLPNVSSCVVTILGLQSRGIVPAMLNYTMGAKAGVAALETAMLKTIITSRAFIEKAKLEELCESLGKHANIIYLEDFREKITLTGKISAWLAARNPERSIRRRLKTVKPDDEALVLFTSGSEGLPKGVVLSHQNILANVAQLASRFDFTSRDVCFNALPVFHSFGMTGGVWLPLVLGMKVFLYPSPLHYRVIPEVVYDVNATLLFGTNVFLAGYAKHAHPYDFYSLRYVVAGAEKLQDETRQLWMEKFGLRIFEGYGATEASPVIAANSPMHFKVGSVGYFLPSITYKLEEVAGIKSGGRLWVKAPNVMAGYLLHDEPGVLQAPEDGWYDTGDIVRVDEDNFVHIEGRLKRFAKLAGEMISLTAVEELASLCWPEYMHVALAVSDANKGEQVVLMSTYKDAERKPLQVCAKAQGINELHVPRQYVYVGEIPLLGTGKVHYPAAQALLAEMMKETP
ncbi:MAG: acyl-[ACP]--phospholipid O-acyltransferase [Proteobacteria bacterium]|nr:MAG: acyl-[ACP]--phospholipid O-acyltransferase [Pseudomonadota bacterium]